MGGLWRPLVTRLMNEQVAEVVPLKLHEKGRNAGIPLKISLLLLLHLEGETFVWDGKAYLSNWEPFHGCYCEEDEGLVPGWL